MILLREHFGRFQGGLQRLACGMLISNPQRTETIPETIPVTEESLIPGYPIVGRSDEIYVSAVQIFAVSYELDGVLVLQAIR